MPVFIFGHAAFAEGVGESLGRIEVPPAWYLVLEPPVAVPTVDIFRAPELKRDTPAISAAAWRPGMGGNDLEAVACTRYPAVAEHLTWLGRFGQARMSGSGACVFVEFAERIAAEAALAQLPEGFRGWVAAGLAEHPLQSLAG